MRHGVSSLRHGERFTLASFSTTRRDSVVSTGAERSEAERRGLVCCRRGLSARSRRRVNPSQPPRFSALSSAMPKPVSLLVGRTSGCGRAMLASGRFSGDDGARHAVAPSRSVWSARAGRRRRPGSSSFMVSVVRVFTPCRESISRQTASASGGRADRRTPVLPGLLHRLGDLRETVARQIDQVEAAARVEEIDLSRGAGLGRHARQRCAGR